MRGQCSSDACSMPRMLNQCSSNAQTMSFQCQFKRCSFNAQITSIQSEFDSQRMLIECSSMPKNLEKSQKSVPKSQKIHSPRHEEAFGERKKTFSATSQGSRNPDAQKTRSRLPLGKSPKLKILNFENPPQKENINLKLLKGPCHRNNFFHISKISPL